MGREVSDCDKKIVQGAQFLDGEILTEKLTVILMIMSEKNKVGMNHSKTHSKMTHFTHDARA